MSDRRTGCDVDGCRQTRRAQGGIKEPVKPLNAVTRLTYVSRCEETEKKTPGVKNVNQTEDTSASHRDLKTHTCIEIQLPPRRVPAKLVCYAEGRAGYTDTDTERQPKKRPWAAHAAPLPYPPSPGRTDYQVPPASQDRLAGSLGLGSRRTHTRSRLRINSPLLFLSGCRALLPGASGRQAVAALCLGRQSCVVWAVRSERNPGNHVISGPDRAFWGPADVSTARGAIQGRSSVRRARSGCQRGGVRFPPPSGGLLLLFTSLSPSTFDPNWYATRYSPEPDWDRPGVDALRDYDVNRWTEKSMAVSRVRGWHTGDASWCGNCVISSLSPGLAENPQLKPQTDDRLIEASPWLPEERSGHPLPKSFGRKTGCSCQDLGTRESVSKNNGVRGRAGTGTTVARSRFVAPGIGLAREGSSSPIKVGGFIWWHVIPSCNPIRSRSDPSSPRCLRR
ncbi:hypothetical protein Bbelb_204270 [Branchiostoma belcheri]|nr:hypothetical protein Bbelb_204270 [Branchiostoma belcheri]